MAVAPLLETCCLAYRAGLMLDTDGIRLRITGSGPLSADLREALRINKPAIVALLTAEQIGQRDDYPSPEPKQFLTLPGCLAPGACARLGWCDRAGARHRCGSGEQ